MSPCQSCHAGCCRTFAVPVTGADILRIERSLKMDFWDFACRWADPQGEIARKYAPQFHFADEPETPFVICLSQASSHFFPKTRKCRFLTEGAPDAEHPLGQARCGIYNSRPGACRAFPTRLNVEGDLAIIYDVPSPRKPDEKPHVNDLCARQWEPADFDHLDTLQDLALTQFEMKFFHQIAAIWNRVPRDWNVFPDFLRLVYANRVISEADSAEAANPRTLAFPTEERRAGLKVA